MDITTEIVDGVEYVIVTYDTGHVTRTLKMSDAAKALLMAQEAEAAAVEAAKEQALNEDFPSWAEVSAEIDAATTIVAMKIIVKKMARVLYLIAKRGLT